MVIFYFVKGPANGFHHSFEWLSKNQEQIKSKMEYEARKKLYLELAERAGGLSPGAFAIYPRG